MGVRQENDVREASNSIKTLESHWNQGNSFISRPAQTDGLDITCLIVEGTEKQDTRIKKSAAHS